MEKGEMTKLKSILIQKGFTQTDLARICDLEFSQVSRIVSGKTGDNIQLKTAKKIAKALGASLDEVWGDDN